MSEPKIPGPSTECAAEEPLREHMPMIKAFSIFGQCFENGRLYIKRLLKNIFGVKTEDKRNVSAFLRRSQLPPRLAADVFGP